MGNGKEQINMLISERKVEKEQKSENADKIKMHNKSGYLLGPSKLT